VHMLLLGKLRFFGQKKGSGRPHILMAVDVQIGSNLAELLGMW
jgi:hypothetical protein